MVGPNDFRRVVDAYPSLLLAKSPLGVELAQAAMLMKAPLGRELMAAGDRAEAVPLLIAGQVRVFTVGESGREITLYRFGGGECCVLTVESLLGKHCFAANARVEDDAELVLIPAAVFDEWMARYPEWRAFVFDAMARRLSGLLTTLEDVAFRRMDVRVAALLATRCQAPSNEVALTHQEIANELGTAREVVSRVLEDLQGRGVIRRARGTIVIADRARLEATAAS
jgi:CRP/FNR family transcriptional regulator